MLAVIPVRDGALPFGAAEVVAECGGRALLAGSAPRIDELAASTAVTDVTLVELGDFAPGSWAVTIGAAIIEGDDDIIVLPASPDGRDLAPRLAHVLRRALHAGAVEVTPNWVRLARGGGLELHDVAIAGPAVVTLQPGVRGVDTPPPDTIEWAKRTISAETALAAGSTRADDGEARVIEVLPADVATMDLGEAQRIVGGGAGLDSPERFAQLARVAAAAGASTGATRVITDRGWIDHDRQIGTTGVVVAPRLYVAFGISGAVQHTAGLGDPDHVVSVNTDAHCPMMQLADLAVVSDANAVLDELERALVGDG